jgi:20S proteasome alpha/beta subunit
MRQSTAWTYRSLILLTTVLWTWSCLSAVVRATTTASTTGTPLSPIANFAASWVASQIQGTTVAIPCRCCSDDKQGDEGDGVVVIFRTSRHLRNSSSKSSDEKDPASPNYPTTTTNRMGLRLIHPIYSSSDALPTSQLGTVPSWTLLSSQGATATASAWCSMTGFAPDVDYLTGVLLQQVDVHATLFHDDTIVTRVGSSALSSHIQTLSSVLQEAGESGRPYGIQALLIGGKQRRHDDHYALRLVTLDPSGGYQDWKYGTAIGYHSDVVRRKLGKCIRQAKGEIETLVSSNGSNRPSQRPFAATGRQALQWGLEALSAAIPDPTNNNGDDQQNRGDSNRCQALLLWRDETTHDLCVAQIDPEELQFSST